MADHRLLQGIAIIDVAKSFDELNRSAYSKKYVDQEQSVCGLKIAEGHPMQKIIPHLWFDKEAKTKGSGWVEYMWPKPGEKTLSKKLSYIKRAKVPTGETVLVGAGIYLK